MKSFKMKRTVKKQIKQKYLNESSIKNMVCLLWGYAAGINEYNFIKVLNIFMDISL